mgnify:CR=1 FL=1
MYLWTDESRIATPWGVAFVCALFVTWFWSRRNAACKGLDTSHIDLLVPLALGAWALGTTGPVAIGAAACLLRLERWQEACDTLLEVHRDAPLLRHRVVRGRPNGPAPRSSAPA